MRGSVVIAVDTGAVAFADRAKTALKAAGLDAASTDDLRDIAACAVFVPIVSDGADGLDRVREQLNAALRMGKPIVPVRVGKHLPEWLQGHKFVSGGRNAIDILLKRLEKIVDEAPDQEAIDITDAEALIRYAVSAQLFHADTTVARIANGNPALDADVLEGYIAGQGSLAAETLAALDDAIVAVGYETGKSYLGGLAQFAVRMRERDDEAAVSTRIPPGWTAGLIGADSDDEIHVLVQGSTLVNTFLVADRVDVAIGTVRAQHHDAITAIVKRLIVLAGGPPSPRQMEAQQLLGSLAKYAFDIVRTELSLSIRQAPLGFRSWRSVTKLLMIAGKLPVLRDGEQPLVTDLRIWLLDLVGEARQIRRSSVYPGRSLDLELFIAIPWGWGVNEKGNLVNHALLERARDDSVTLRERGTAAMGMWQRAVDNGRAEEVRNELESLIKGLEDEAARERDRGQSATEAEPRAQSGIADGLTWVATTLKDAMQRNVAISSVLPVSPDPWYASIQQVADALAQGMPPAVGAPTSALFRHALLQNAGVARRRAIDTLTAGGLVEESARQMFRLLDGPLAVDAWLRIRVLFALGFMQVRTTDARDDLVRACQRAAQRLIAGMSNRAEITELQEALFAVADVFGATTVDGSDPRASQFGPESLAKQPCHVGRARTHPGHEPASRGASPGLLLDLHRPGRFRGPVAPALGAAPRARGPCHRGVR